MGNTPDLKRKTKPGLFRNKHINVETEVYADPLLDLPLSVKIKKDWQKNMTLYFLFIPVLVYCIVFQYGSMAGLFIAFQNYKPSLGIMNSKFVGLKHFKDFYFQRVLTNTIKISVTSLVCSFPMPIILALLINELKSKRFSKIVQTITYIPHFISVVVVVSIVMDLTSSDGAITSFLSHFGFPKITMLNDKRFFLPLYIISGIWQNIGWNSIIYLSVLTAIDAELYEAARIDGAGKMRQLFSITIPCLIPTIVIMLILRELLILDDAAIATSGGQDALALASDTVKYATIVVATVPILIVYPFLQKYFVKGVMVGAVKG